MFKPPLGTAGLGSDMHGGKYTVTAVLRPETIDKVNKMADKYCLSKSTLIRYMVEHCIEEEEEDECRTDEGKDLHEKV